MSEVAATIGYKFKDFKSPSEGDIPRAKLSIVCNKNDDIEETISHRNKANSFLDSMSSAIENAKNLILMPPNIANPEYIANKAAEILEHLGVTIKTLNEREMKKLGFGALLAVSSGSANNPVLLVMEWSPKSKSGDEYDIALVGKGVTFDSGGLSIKSSDNMQEMKGDMSGAAVVIGIMEMLAKEKIQSRVVGVVGLVENMPSDSAARPGDIIKSLSGKTIEILNTDAEGRLVLADAIWYVQTEYKVKKVIDIATLTGAAIVALGTHAAPCISNNTSFVEDLISLGIKSGEPMWRLPMDPLYDKMIESPLADIANISIKGGGAGTITGAQFVGSFIKDGVSWIHMDIAGSISHSSKYMDNSIRAFGIKTIFKYIRSHLADGAGCCAR